MCNKILSTIELNKNTYMCEAYKLVKQHMHVDKGNLLCLNMPHQLQGKLSLGPWPCQEVKYFLIYSTLQLSYEYCPLQECDKVKTTFEGINN